MSNIFLFCARLPIYRSCLSFLDSEGSGEFVALLSLSLPHAMYEGGMGFVLRGATISHYTGVPRDFGAFLLWVVWRVQP